ncbi:MAG TPA: hypothetical protein VFP56_03500 [Candidatus Limnocylindrales bacterium]|nr:hypothetical protein [Candidatus Limnocylindrales bacterium]
MRDRQQDPWSDMPRWSDDGGPPAAEAAPGADAPVGTGAETDVGRAVETVADTGSSSERAACPWCATPAPDGATRCASCGAALAQRESIGDLVVPGLTAVDPALKDLDGRPLHLRGPSPTQGVASGLVVAAAAGGPIGLAIIGGVGALAAAEYMGAGGDGGRGHENVGEASDAVRQAIERLDRGETLPTAHDVTPRPELDSTSTASGAQSPDPSAPGGATGGAAPSAGRTTQEEASDGGG